MKALDAVPWMGAIAGVGLLLDSLEVIVERRALAPSGIYSWNVLSSGRRHLAFGSLSRLWRGIFLYPNVLVLPMLQIASALVLFAAGIMPPGLHQRVAIAVATLVAISSRLLLHVRQQIGLDGADQMLVVVLMSCGLGAVLGNTDAGCAAVSYAALQLVLSYTVAGAAKLVSKEWRSGRAIVGITGTVSYGQMTVHRVMSRFPRVAVLACWTLMLYECASPAFVLGGSYGVITLIVMGALFHIGVAAFMGLNIFPWAFGACYPALLVLPVHIDSV